MNIQHVSYFYPLFVVAIVFYFLGRWDKEKEFQMLFKKWNKIKNEVINETKKD
jgi:hypothetical protein